MGSKGSKKSKFFLIILFSMNFITLTIPKISGAGHGEENESLGQFVDDFENLNNVSAIVDLIRNPTLNTIELNTTDIIPVYVDFDSYIESDALNRLTQGDTFSNWTSMSRTDDNIYLYKDYGVDYFDDFIHEFELCMDSVPGYATPLVLVMVTCYTDGLGDWIELRGASIDQIAIVVATTNNEEGYRIQMRESFAGSDETNLGTVELDEDTVYYLRAIKDGTMWRGLVYSDSMRTNLIDNITLTLDADHKLRYHLPPQSPDFPTASPHTGYINNYWMGDISGGFEIDGYFITEYYSNYTTGQTLTLLTNANITESTSITAEFSEDNATWVDNEGNVGGSDILDGFYALDLRDLNYTDCLIRYNFSGPGDSTPRFNQSRLITTEGPPSENGNGDTIIMGGAGVFWIILIIIVPIVVYMVSRR